MPFFFLDKIKKAINLGSFFNAFACDMFEPKLEVERLKVILLTAKHGSLFSLSDFRAFMQMIMLFQGGMFYNENVNFFAIFLETKHNICF